MNRREMEDLIGYHRAYLQGNPKGVRADLSNKDLININFRNSNLAYADFSFSCLENINFENTNLLGADFTEATFYNCNFEGANVDEAIFVGVNIDDIDLTEAANTDTIIKDEYLTDPSLYYTSEEDDDEEDEE